MNVANLDALGGAIKRISLRRVQTHIKPEHDPPVAPALLPAFKDVLYR